MKTIFEKIISREIPADILHEDETCIRNKGYRTTGTNSLLNYPQEIKLKGLLKLAPSDKETLGHLLLIAQKTAGDLGLDNGFRIVINNGTDGGESVPHLHLHLLGGRQMKWPPG